MKNNYDRKTGYVFGGASSFWLLFVAIAFVVWLSPLFVEQEGSLTRTMLLGAAALLLGFSLRFMYYGTQIDPEKQKIREYTSILGYKAGNWESLPSLNKLRLTSNSTRSWNTPNGTSPTMQHTRTTFSIALYSHAGTPAYVITTENKKAALQDVSTLSDMLHLDVEERL